MDPMNSFWYFLEFQRQSSAADRSPAEPFTKSEVRARKSVKGGVIEFGVPFFVLAVLITFGLVLFLCPTFLS